jgi:hypothetical protein
MNERMNIDFAEMGMPVFTGRARGESTRKELQIEKYGEGDIVRVSIPESVYTITSSYFLGLFGPSIRKLGLKNFEQVFRFEAPDYLQEKIKEWSARAVRDKGDLFQ